MFVPVLLFLLGLLLLIKGGDWFVDGATGIAHHFGIPELLIGATVVSIGTTLPEVMVSASAAFSGHGEIAYGNAIGSIICNTSLIAALTIAIKPGKVDRKTLISPVLFFFTAAAFYSFVAYSSGHFSRITGFLLLGLFVIYMVYTVLQMKGDRSAQTYSVSTVKSDIGSGNSGKTDSAAAATSDTSDEKSRKNNSGSETSEPENSMGKNILLLVVGAALIAFGARLLVDNGTLIAEALGVPESVIALTFVALGTSLPELVTAITSLAKGHGALSLGNVIGANLFNLVLVSGISIAIAPFDIPQSSFVAGRNASLAVDIPVMFFVMLLMTVPALVRNKLARVQGILLLAIYAAYCVFQFAM